MSKYHKNKNWNSNVTFLGFSDEHLAAYLTKSVFGPPGYSCTFCEKYFPDKSKGKNHVEAMHIPSAGYNCDACGKFCKTRHALTCHKSSYHNKKWM